MWARSRSVRTAKESTTSRAVISTMTPRERNSPTCATSASRSFFKSSSSSADQSLPSVEPASALDSLALLDARYQHLIDGRARASRQAVGEDGADRELVAEPGVLP